VGSVPYSVRADIAGNSYCPSVPCDQSDFTSVTQETTIGAKNSGTVTAYCPADKPVPVVGSCMVSTSWVHLAESFQINWTKAAEWEPGNMAGWSCSAMNTHETGAYILYSNITCKRR
jgi:hypothetical protein